MAADMTQQAGEGDMTTQSRAHRVDATYAPAGTPSRGAAPAGMGG